MLVHIFNKQTVWTGVDGERSLLWLLSETTKRKEEFTSKLAMQIVKYLIVNYSETSNIGCHSLSCTFETVKATFNMTYDT